MDSRLKNAAIGMCIGGGVIFVTFVASWGVAWIFNRFVIIGIGLLIGAGVGFFQEVREE